MKKILSYFLLVFWLSVIFYFSNQSGTISSSGSGGIIYNILNSIYNIFNIDTQNLSYITEILHNPIRELVHVMEYFVLGILTLNCLKQNNVDKKVLITIMFCFIYSVTDEIHQMFVPGRTFEYYDIIMDNLGAILAVTLLNTKLSIKIQK